MITTTISPELLEKLQYFAKYGSCSMSRPLKQELAEHYKQITGNTLNIDCGACVTQAMHRVNAELKGKKKKAKNVQFTGVAQSEFDGMNFMKLKSLAKAKAKELGIEIAKDAKKDELIKILTDASATQSNSETESNGEA